jgi:NAD(P)-dependent dehydrogenase (short-subunit alcohol dehydrogenase family)
MEDTGRLPSEEFRGQTAVITGATKGIGRDIATSFARAGCNLGVTGRNERELQELAEEADALGVNCRSYKADLSSARECLEMAEHFAASFPVIDILVNNAGVSFPQKLVNLEVSDWDATLAVNLRAPALISKVIAAKMIEQGRGTIINISSNACLAGLPEHAAYCASKHGLDGLTKVMAVELGPHHIRVNAVAPVVTLTPMGTKVWGDPKKADPVKAKIPLGRFAYPSEITSAVFFLASAGAGMIHGETLVIDGGVNANLY